MNRIARLETFTNEFVCFVRVTTDDGAIGWGQTSTYNADITAQVLHRQVAPWVLGGDAADIPALIRLVEEREHKFPGSYRCRALAGLDTALWDLRGRQEDKPVVELLGGTPGKLRAYASSMKRDITPEDEAARFVKLRDEKGSTPSSGASARNAGAISTNGRVGRKRSSRWCRGRSATAWPSWSTAIAAFHPLAPSRSAIFLRRKGSAISRNPALIGTWNRRRKWPTR